MDDFPWAYVVMIFIAFVSWVCNRIVEVAAARRVRAEKRRAAAEAAKKERPLPRESLPSPFRPSAAPSAPSPQAAPPALPQTPSLPVPTEETGVPRSFREFFEMLEKVSNPEARTAPPSTPAPPPLPVPAAKPAPSKPASEEPVKGFQKESLRSASTRKAGLTAVLRKRSSLRQSLILKEILDVPVSLR